jgi:hypothetical protein
MQQVVFARQDVKLANEFLKPCLLPWSLAVRLNSYQNRSHSTILTQLQKHLEEFHFISEELQRGQTQCQTGSLILPQQGIVTNYD